MSTPSFDFCCNIKMVGSELALATSMDPSCLLGPLPSEYCCWPRLSLYDHCVPILWWLLPAGTYACHKAQIISNSFLNILKGLQRHQIWVKHLCMWWNEKLCHGYAATACLSNVSIILLLLTASSSYLLLIKNWGSSEGNRGSSLVSSTRVYFMKWPVSLEPNLISREKDQ